MNWDSNRKGQRLSPRAISQTGIGFSSILALRAGGNTGVCTAVFAELWLIEAFFEGFPGGAYLFIGIPPFLPEVLATMLLCL